MTIHARKTTFLTRTANVTRPYARPGVALPPRALLEGHPEVLGAYDTMVRLNAAIAEQGEAARTASRDAEAAKIAYQRDRAEALAAGKDVAKVKDREPELREKAAAHLALRDAAQVEATAHGHVLGRMLAALAPELFAVAEQAMTTEAEQVRAAVAALEGQWARWAAAWHLRATLSAAHYNGGPLGAHKPDVPLPADVAAALATLEDHLKNLDRLREDEATVAAWREREAQAQASTEADPSSRFVAL